MGCLLEKKKKIGMWGELDRLENKLFKDMCYVLSITICNVVEEK